MNQSFEEVIEIVGNANKELTQCEKCGSPMVKRDLDDEEGDETYEFLKCLKCGNERSL